MAIGRREFLAGLGGIGMGLGLGAVSHWLPLAPPEFGPDWSPNMEEFVSSTCLLCPSHCGIRGRVVDGNLVRIDGNPLHPVSMGGLCPKGRAGIQLLYHPARLTGPVERTGPPGSSEFRRISWDEALDRVGKTLADLAGKGKPHSAVWIAGDESGLMRELLQRFTRATRTPHLVWENYDDGSEKVLELSQGIRSAPAFDLQAAELILSFGASLSEAWWSLPQAARAREPREGSAPRWIQFDVRLSRTASRSSEWIPVRPGTYGTLAMGIAYILLKEGLYDVDRIESEVEGIEDERAADGSVLAGFRSLVLRHGRTEEVSRHTGVPAESIIRVAKAFGTSRHSVAVWDQAVSWRRGGLQDAMAIHALNILVGAPGRAGGVLLQPELPVPSFADEGEPVGESPLTAGNWAARVAPGNAFGLEAVFLYKSNPLASAANPEEVRRALERTPLVVSFSPFLDESSRYAHLVLPDHTYLERWQDAPAPASVPIPVWGLVQPMTSPLHETRATGEVLLSLASRLGERVASRFPWSTMEQIVEERGHALSEASRGGVMTDRFQRGELRELEARGWWIPHGLSREEFWDALKESGGWFDPYYDYNDRTAISRLRDGKVRVFTITSFTEPAARDWPEAAEDSHYPLLLVPYRVMTLSSGATPLMPWLLENLGVLTGDAWEAWAEINPETGRRLGLTPGRLVRIRSTTGEFRARLRFFEGAQPGVINVPYGLHTTVEGWGDAAGANPLHAIGNVHDSGSGLPDWFSTHVRVEPA